MEQPLVNVLRNVWSPKQQHLKNCRPHFAFFLNWPPWQMSGTKITGEQHHTNSQTRWCKCESLGLLCCFRVRICPGWCERLIISLGGNYFSPRDRQAVRNMQERGQMLLHGAAECKTFISTWSIYRLSRGGLGYDVGVLDDLWILKREVNFQLLLLLKM